MKKTARKGFIYFRYALPLILAAVLVVLMLLPTYRFITADTGVGETVSLGELLSNSFATAREYIFKSGEKAVPTMDFSVTLLVCVCLMWLLFFIGVISAIFEAYEMVMLCRGIRTSRSRILFVTLSVNRGFLCIWHALMLPIFLLPRIMPLLYGEILAYRVELVCAPFDMLWVALVLYALTAAVIFVSKKYERLEELDIYRLPEKKIEVMKENTEEEIQEDEPEDEYEAMMRRARAEQAESILRLLNKNGDDDGEEEK